MQCASSHPHPHLNYQEQDSALTLAEGLEEYYAANCGVVTRPRDLPAESVGLFRSHDICHVIFGLDTTLDDEALADVRTLFSSDVGWKRYGAYLARDKQAQALFKQLDLAKGVWAMLASLPRIFRAFVEARRMNKAWPWSPPESFEARTLSDLRREFGICVI